MKTEPNPENDDRPENDEASVDGILREYARTGSSSDDEVFIRGVREQIALGSTVVCPNPWIFGRPFWLSAAAAVAVFASVIGMQSAAIFGRSADPTQIVATTQPRALPGGNAQVTAVVRNGETLDPIANTEVEAFLVSSERPALRLGSGTSDEFGHVQVSAPLPEDLPEGDYEIELVAKAPGSGKAKLTRPLAVQRSFRTMLSSDKPLYQPGQVIHLRALSLDSDELKPAAGRDVAFEIRDPKGNKVFGKKLQTSDFGIASADFQLASQVNEGAYTIVARVGDTTSERTVKVERYTLPKFRIDLATDRPFYGPGQTIGLTVDSRYTFGEPVADAAVTVVAERYLQDFDEFLRLEGRTGPDGIATFEVPIDVALVGQPLKKGDAFVRLVAEVEDGAGHTRTTTKQVTVTDRPIRIEAFPESGELVRNVANTVYLLTTYPDGRPARTTLQVGDGQGEVKTSRLGIAKIQLTPKSKNLRLTVEARDSEGARARRQIPLRVGEQTDAFLVRTDRAIYGHGDSVKLDIFSATPTRRVFVDVVKDGRSVLTSSVEIADGTGQLVLDLPADLVGTLQIQGYSIDSDGEMVGDTRLIQVNSSDALQVDATLDRESYRPAEKAIVEFLVRGKDGTPTEAALSLSAVDEAVFALNDMRPGLEEIYFLVQQEILEPRYQLVTRPQVDLSRGAPPVDDQEDLVEADVAFFSTGEGTSAMPESDASESFAERSVDIREAQDEQRDRVNASLVSLPLILFGLLVLGLLGFTFRSFARAEVALAKEAEVKAFRSRIRRLLGALALAIAGPVLLGVLLGNLNVNEDTVLLSLCLAVLAGSVLVFRSQAKAARTVVARRSPTLRRCLRAVPFLQLGLFAAPMLAGWMMDALGLYRIESVVVPAILGMLASIALIGAAALTWYRPAAGLEGLGHGLLAFGWRALAGLAIVGVPLIALMMSTMGGRASARGAMPEMMMDAVAGVEREMAFFSADPDETKAEEGFETEEAQEGKGSPGPRVRKHFPETLLWQPQLLTDSGGRARLEIDLADSITTWRLSGSAVTRDGRLGSTEQGIRVFQPFFVDIDFPVELTQNDEVSVPIAVYNYLDKPQEVEIEIKAASWFEFLGDGAEIRTITVPAKGATSTSLDLRATRPGLGRLTVFARGGDLADAVERSVRVRPDGERIEIVRNGRIGDEGVRETLTIPENAIEGGSDLFVKIYPGAFSQVVEGMDSIFQMPHGCFEQTSSTTYPNILTLDYLRETGTPAPEIEIKALNFINIGYQRLISYEVDGGGFSWFGEAPAHPVLTAYGLMEFVDMAKVHEVDEALIERTRDWLLDQRKGDGSWASSNRGIAEGAINKFQGEQELRTTAYIAWAVAQAGADRSDMGKTYGYLQEHLSKLTDPYSLVLCAQVFLELGDREEAIPLLDRLVAEVALGEKGEIASWSSEGESLTYGRGDSFSIETTALVAQALIAAEHEVGLAHKALAWLIEQKDGRGTWHSTQATVQAMRALLAGARGAGAGAGSDLEVTILANGEEAGRIAITEENRDVYHLQSLTEHVRSGDIPIEIRTSEKSGFAYQIVAVHYLPRDTPRGKTPPAEELLTIETDYSTKRLAAKDELKVTATLRYQRPENAPMTLVDFGVPPGFDVVQPSLEKLVKKGTIERFTVHGRQVTLYFSSIPGGGKPTRFNYRLRAKFPVKAQAPSLVAYQYYEPEVRAMTEPVLLMVQ